MRVFHKSLLAAGAAAALWLSAASGVQAEPQLLMVEQPGCVYCAAWDEEIAPIYPKTPEGQHAPLHRVQLRDGAPEGITYDRRVAFTPTFILVDGGKELARIEGYPGEDFFWGLLEMMLTEHAGFVPEVTAATPATETEG